MTLTELQAGLPGLEFREETYADAEYVYAVLRVKTGNHRHFSAAWTVHTHPECADLRERERSLAIGKLIRYIVSGQ